MRAVISCSFVSARCSHSQFQCRLVAHHSRPEKLFTMVLGLRPVHFFIVFVWHLLNITRLTEHVPPLVHLGSRIVSGCWWYPPFVHTSSSCGGLAWVFLGSLYCVLATRRVQRNSSPWVCFGAQATLVVFALLRLSLVVFPMLFSRVLCFSFPMWRKILSCCFAISRCCHISAFFFILLSPKTHGEEFLWTSFLCFEFSFDN